ncbi:MAG: 4a-hydroxytetrahydrobiopterin dehydratase [Myxococcota bacterium]
MLKHCKPCEGGVSPMSLKDASTRVQQLKGWSLSLEGDNISKFWLFKNHYQVMAFINAIAFISHREGHHPDITFGYNSARVIYTTHAVKGLSENDFICASYIDALSE